MKKVLIFFVFLFFLNVLEVEAIEEITVACKKENCLNSSNLPIFSENKVYPGFSINKKIKVINETDFPCSLNLKIKKEKDFNNKLAEKILMKINNKNYSLNKIIENFIYLGKIPKDNFKFYDLSYTFDKQSGNEFKNKNIDFKMDFSFECENKEQIVHNDKQILGSTIENNDLPGIAWLFLFLIITSIFSFMLLIFKRIRHNN